MRREGARYREPLCSCEGRSPARSNNAVAPATQASTPPRFPKGSRGFTLIELMVVLVIIGLISGAVMLTMADPRGRMAGDIDRFAGRVRAARDGAIIAGKPVALWVSPTAFGFERRAAGQWESVSEGPLTSRDWSGGTRAQLGAATQLRTVFDSVGRADQPLRFTLLRDGRQVALRMDLDGKVTSSE